MDAQVLQHDPRTKQQVKEILYQFLYQPVQQQYRAKLSNIIEKNCTLMAASYPAFQHRGTVYSVAEEATRLPKSMTRLAPQLEPMFLEFLAEMKQLNEYELPYVLGFINQVLNSSNDLQDYLRVLPASVHQPIQDLIASCGCRTTKLTPEDVKQLQERNQLPIDLMKQRLVRNLLL